MPTNLIRNYNLLLEMLHNSHSANINSLRGVYSRDFMHSGNTFNGLIVLPTPADNTDAHDREFWHLTTTVTNEATRKREFDRERALRIHWIKPHLENSIQDEVVVFKVHYEKRLYILNKTERYVVILEPRRDQQSFYLITAYNLYPSGYKKMMGKIEKGAEVL